MRSFLKVYKYWVYPSTFDRCFRIALVNIIQYFLWLWAVQVILKIIKTLISKFHGWSLRFLYWIPFYLKSLHNKIYVYKILLSLYNLWIAPFKGALQCDVQNKRTKISYFKWCPWVLKNSMLWIYVVGCRYRHSHSYNWRRAKSKVSSHYMVKKHQ